MTTVLNAVNVETTSVNNKLTNEEIIMTDSLTANVATDVNDELTNEEITMTTKKLNAHIIMMNDAIDVSKSTNLTMFQVFKDAFNEYSKDIENFKIFKDGINLEQSSINKMEKICGSKAIKDNVDKLPISWGTLHAMSTMKEPQILEAIESEKFNPKTTREEVTEYKKLLNPKKNGTKGDAKAKTEKDILEDVFFKQLSSTFIEKKNIDEKGHKDIKKALNILKKYYEITPELDIKKVA